MDTLENLSWRAVIFDNPEYFDFYWIRQYENEDFYDDETMFTIFTFMREYLHLESEKNISLGYINTTSNVEFILEINMNRILDDPEEWEIAFSLDFEINQEGKLIPNLWLNDKNITGYSFLVGLIFPKYIRSNFDKLTEPTCCSDYHKMKITKSWLMDIREYFLNIINRTELNFLSMFTRISNSMLESEEKFEYLSQTSDV